MKSLLGFGYLRACFFHNNARFSGQTSERLPSTMKFFHRYLTLCDWNMTLVNGSMFGNIRQTMLLTKLNMLEAAEEL